MSRLKDRLHFAERNLDKEENLKEAKGALLLLYNEISKENERNSSIQFVKVDSLNKEFVEDALLSEVSEYLQELNHYYIDEYNHYNDEKDQLLIGMNKTEEDKAAFVEMKNKYTNESLENLVTNKNSLDKIIEWEGEFIQRADPIYKDPEGFRAHFLAPSKRLFGINITTFSANLLVLWGFSIFLAITLYYDGLRRLLTFLGNLFQKKKH